MPDPLMERILELEIEVEHLRARLAAVEQPADPVLKAAFHKAAGPPLVADEALAEQKPGER